MEMYLERKRVECFAVFPGYNQLEIHFSFCITFLLRVQSHGEANVFQQNRACLNYFHLKGNPLRIFNQTFMDIHYRTNNELLTIDA